jgi:hypothetical protein
MILQGITTLILLITGAYLWYLVYQNHKAAKSSRKV